MTQPFRSTHTAKETAARGEIAIRKSFDYALLEEGTAQQVQAAAKRIRQMIKRTLEDLIVIGNDLLAVKEALPYGKFGPWLRTEFGWTDRTARNFIAVAQRFGTKAEVISELRIEPTAAYLLAAPSVPEEASAAAVRRAEEGERITVSVAKEILHKVRKKPVRRRERSAKSPTSDKLLGQLLASLESYRQRWDPHQFSILARQLRDFADSLVEQRPGSQNRKG